MVDCFRRNTLYLTSQTYTRRVIDHHRRTLTSFELTVIESVSLIC